MSWRERRQPRRGGMRPVGLAAMLLVAAASLDGCGFQPLYARHEKEFNADLAAIRVTTIPNRIGQLIEISLRDSFNPTDIKVEQRYNLEVLLQQSLGDFAIRSDGTASRQVYYAIANFTLRDAKTGDSVFAGTTRWNDSFNVAESEYSVIVAEDTAAKRAAREISEDIYTRVSMYFRQKKDNG
jgi:LPS-assembly lipoprotein